MKTYSGYKAANMSYEEAAALPFGGTAGIAFPKEKQHSARTKNNYLWSFRGANGFSSSSVSQTIKVRELLQFAGCILIVH